MMVGPPKLLPKNYETWLLAIRERDLSGETVHGAELASGSKMEYEQFLLLRVLWKTHGKRDYLGFLPEKLKRFLPVANQLLSHFRSWRIYCSSFQASTIPEGSFAVARHYQMLAANNEESAELHGLDTPIAKRTRSQVGALRTQFSRLQFDPFETPSKKPSKPLQTPNLDRYLDDEVMAEDSPSPSPSPITPAALVPPELQNLMFPPTKDEQIVNIALVVFLNALTIHFDSSRKCTWTPHRKGFTANFEEASFEARTDGYLDDGQENALALIEVKPVQRSKIQNRIQMQESAQMVGWIMNELGDSKDTLRIILSQDRHEIFLTYAEYDDDYLAYLKNKPPGKKMPSFLTMHQFGPWDIGKVSHMRELGPLLLALTLYAASEIRAGQF